MEEPDEYFDGPWSEFRRLRTEYDKSHGCTCEMTFLWRPCDIHPDDPEDGQMLVAHHDTCRISRLAMAKNN